jgi:hypothetical protein
MKFFDLGERDDLFLLVRPLVLCPSRDRTKR